MLKLEEKVETVFKGDSTCAHIFLGDSVKEAVREGDYIIEIKERKCALCGKTENVKIFNPINTTINS